MCVVDIEEIESAARWRVWSLPPLKQRSSCPRMTTLPAHLLSQASRCVEQFPTRFLVPPLLVFSLFFCRLYTQSLIILMIMPRPKGPRNQGLLKKDLELESLGSTRGLSA